MNRSLKSYVQDVGVGGLAGTLGSVVQVGIGYMLSKFLLPDDEDNNIAPRLVHHMLSLAGQDHDEKRDWELGALFHLSYGLGWGMVFGLLQRVTRLRAFMLAVAMGGLIYTLAFSRIGVATQTGAEQHPDGRSWQKRVSLVAVALTYMLATAWFWNRLNPLLRPNEYTRGKSS